MKNVVTIVLALVLISIAGAALAFGTSKFSKEVVTESAAVKLFREVKAGGYDVITTAELQQAMSAKEDMLIIDTMPYEASYLKNHIPGAKQFLFPIAEMAQWNSAETGGKSDDDFIALLGENKDRKIVVYCGFVKCTRSHNGAMWATKLGYTNVYRHPGGIYAWKGADYEVETGK